MQTLTVSPYDAPLQPTPNACVLFNACLILQYSHGSRAQTSVEATISTTAILWMTTAKWTRDFASQ